MAGLEERSLHGRAGLQAFEGALKPRIRQTARGHKGLPLCCLHLFICPCLVCILRQRRAKPWTRVHGCQPQLVLDSRRRQRPSSFSCTRHRHGCKRVRIRCTCHFMLLCPNMYKPVTCITTSTSVQYVRPTDFNGQASLLFLIAPPTAVVSLFSFTPSLPANGVVCGAEPVEQAPQ